MSSKAMPMHALGLFHVLFSPVFGYNKFIVSLYLKQKISSMGL